MTPLIEQHQREVRNQAVRDFTFLKERENGARKRPTPCGPSTAKEMKVCGACNRSQDLSAYDADTTRPSGKLNICRSCAERQRKFKSEALRIIWHRILCAIRHNRD